MNRRVILFIALILLCSGAARAEWVLEPFAGGGPDDLPALEANVGRPTAVAIDASGRVFILSAEHEHILMLDDAGRIHMYLENRRTDVLNGTQADPVDLFVDPQGALRVVDYGGAIGEIDPTSGDYVLTIVRKGPLRSAVMDEQGAVLFILESMGPRQAVYRWDPVTNAVTVVAGVECQTYPWPPPCYQPSQDGVPATQTALGVLNGVALGPGGDLYILDGHRVRRVDAVTGILSTVAGTGTGGFSGDGGPAIEATLRSPADLEFDAAGHLYIADTGNNRVRRVDAVTGWIDTVAGNGDGAFSGDGGPATEASLRSPVSVTLDGAGNLLIADSANDRIRRVSAAAGIIETVAGNGTLCYAGDGHLAAQASIGGVPAAIDSEGNLLIADRRNSRVRKVDAVTGVITTVAGNGESTPDVEDEGVPADQAVIIAPGDIVFDSAGNLLLTDGEGNLRRIDAASGLITTVEGIRGGGLAIDDLDRLYVTTSWRGVDRFNIVTGETVHVVGGTLWPSDAEAVPATEIELMIGDIAIGPSGDLFLSEGYRRSVRSVDHDSGLIHTVAGGYFSGPVDRCPYPQPALGALVMPSQIDLDAAGNLFLVDMFGDMVGRVDPLTGVMHKVVGAGRRPAGEPLPPGSVVLMPGSVLPDGQGNLYITAGNRILLARNVNETPVADAGGHVDLDCNSPTGRTVHLDGSSSFDPDDVPGGEAEIQFHWWYEDYGLPGERLIAKGESADVELSTGSHAITLRVGDRWGAWGADTIVVTIADADDADSDGVGSCADNCPGLFNPDQTDADGNGRGDDCDPCLGSPFDDTDGDGICADTDNCPGLPNPLQLDRDSDGTGDDCDVCADAYNPDQEESGTCMAAGSGTGECLPIRIDPVEDGRWGRALLFEIPKLPPEGIVFTVRYQACELGDTFEFLLNGQPIYNVSSVWPTYYCGTPCRARSEGYGLASAAVAAAWNPAGPNELRFVKRGSRSGVQWVKASIRSGEDAFDVCILDQEGGQCDAEPSCVAGETDGDLDAAATTDLVLRDEREVREIRYGPAALSESVDAASWPDGEYRICLTATDRDDPGTLYAATSWGELLEIDFLTGASRMAGVLPVRPLDIAYEPMGQRGVASSYRSFVHAFDIRDGAKSGGIVPTPTSYTVLEKAGSTLYAVRLFADYNDQYPDVRSYFYSLDSETGQAQYAGTLMDRWVADLAYDASSDRLFAQFGSNSYDSQPAGRCTAWVEPSADEVGDSTCVGVKLGSLSFGPDGLLYGVVLDTGSPGLLHRIDLAAETATPIGDTGFTDIVGLTLAGAPGTLDCIEFVKQGQDILALNDSCGPPTAVAQAPEEAECASPAGAAVLLDGSGSSDPNSLPGTNDGIVAFDWFEDYGLPAERPLGSGSVLLVDLPVGVHEITLRVTNRFGETGFDGAVVTVTDTVPPEISFSLDPAVLWPPDHRMIAITASVVATDLCGAPAVALVSISSDEPDNSTGGGDGNTVDDIQGAEYGACDLEFELRAERAGSGDGRVYEVVYSATDAAGNVTEATGAVVVPHLSDGEDKNWRWRVYKGEGPAAGRPAE